MKGFITRAYIEGIDKKDIRARALLTEEAYEKAYVPMTKGLQNAPKKVRKAAQDTALLYARMADNFVAQYGGKTEEILPLLRMEAQNQEGAYRQPVTEVLDMTESYAPVNLDELVDGIGITKEDEPSTTMAIRKIEETLKGVSIPTKEASVLLDIDGIGDGVGARHIVKAFSQKGTNTRAVNARKIRNKTITNGEHILSHAIFVEYMEGKQNKRGYFAEPKHDEKVTGVIRLVVPVTFGGVDYVLVVTAQTFTKSVKFDRQPAMLYEMYPRKLKGSRPAKASPASRSLGDEVPVSYNILDILSSVKDLSGKPYVNEEGQLNMDLRQEGGEKEEPKTYRQPVTSGIAPDTNVEVVDITEALPKGATNKELLQYIKSLAGTPVTTADSKAVFELLPKKASHIVYSSKKLMGKDESKTRRKAIARIGDLLEKAVLIESAPNRKVRSTEGIERNRKRAQAEKNQVRYYHRFYVPVRVGNAVYTVRIVGEEDNGTITVNPTRVHLYDVMIDKKNDALLAPSSYDEYSMEERRSFDVITIQQMLSDVKDVQHNNYFQKQTYTKTAEEKLAEDEKAFGEQIDAFMNNTMKDISVKVMTTPLVMKLIGADVLPVYMHQNVFKKVLKGKHREEIIPALLKQVPRALTNPLAIVESGGKPVVITELKSTKGDPVVVPFVLNKRVGSHGGYEANIVASVYGKESERWVVSHLEKNAQYVNKKRIRNWLRLSAELQLLMEATKLDSFDSKIPDEQDLVKLKEEYLSFYQEEGAARGAYGEADNVISLFNGANASTVLHETAHWWLTFLERAAEKNGNAAKDLATIRRWAGYSKEAAEEYRGTSLEAEFARHEQQVLAGKQGAEEVFLQERFARGWERYVMTGKAPTKELRDVFRRLMEQLKEIYRTVKSLGNTDAPQEIRDIFDRMLASDKDIEAWAAERRLADMDKGIDYTQSEAESIAAHRVVKRTEILRGMSRPVKLTDIKRNDNIMHIK